MRYALVFAFVLLFPAVEAGTAAEPEIWDPAGVLDSANPQSPGSFTVLTPEIDLNAVWFDANETTVGVSWKVVDNSHQIQEDQQRILDLDLECGTDDVTVSAYPDWGVWSQGSVFVGRADGTHASQHPLPLTVEGNMLRVDVPRDLFACAKITRPHATSWLLVRTSQNTWEGFPPIVDFAPNAGYGRDYTIA